MTAPDPSRDRRCGVAVGQSRRMSFAESCVNVLVGFGVAMVAQVAVFPLFGIHVPIASNLGIGAVFTVVSVVRSYALRRAFNWWHHRVALPRRGA